MKKLVLGLLALSAVSFAASNPGDDNATATTNHKGTVGVPMEVRVNLLPQQGRLILVDENNKLIDKLVFDHGDIIMGNATSDSKVEKTVRLTTDTKGTKLGNNKVTFIAKDAAGQPITSTSDFILNGHGAASADKVGIKSKLEYREQKFDANNAEYVETKVVSIIPATQLNDSARKSGLYVGNGTFEAEVTNK